MLKNVTVEEIATFRRNVELIVLAGEQRPSLIADQISRCFSRNPGAVARSSFQTAIETVVEEANPLVLDPAGYFVVYPESRRRTLVLEHYTNTGVLDAVLEGHTPGALYQAAISRGLVSRLDHAAYLGRELGRAEQSLNDGTPYIQDRAPEPHPAPKSQVSTCGCPEGNCS